MMIAMYITQRNIISIFRFIMSFFSKFNLSLSYLKLCYMYFRFCVNMSIIELGNPIKP